VLRLPRKNENVSDLGACLKRCLHQRSEVAEAAPQISVYLERWHNCGRSGAATHSVRRERVRVSPGSLVTVHRNIYPMHSRLIGEMVEARVKPIRSRSGMPIRSRRAGRACVAKQGQIDYRTYQLLACEPGAFEDYRYQRDHSRQLAPLGLRCPARRARSKRGACSEFWYSDFGTGASKQAVDG